MDGETPRRSGKSGRQEQIIADLRLYPAMRVGELAERLGVSSETIRRDLAELDERGLINRTYGGAMRPVVYEPGLAEREGLMVPERQRIAAAAVAGIEANDILMIGGGATTLHFAHRLAAVQQPLTVITHAFSIALALSVNPLIRILMLPGQYDGREGLIHGADTIDALQRFRANVAVLGASGLTVEGPNDAAMGPGLTYGAMMRRSARTLVLADHSKFNRPSLTVYGPWNPAITLITDMQPDGELAEAMASAGAGVEIA
ncbi:MAG: DeoR/GlpR transcriptional regulator [Rhodobiaceae bacterium]|nr:DeoR/GlpR transcriptional regulator [Rhodobiaceae bacterium]